MVSGRIITTFRHELVAPIGNDFNLSDISEHMTL